MNMPHTAAVVRPPGAQPCRHDAMSFQCYDLHGIRILECAAAGPQIRTGLDAVELIAAASSHTAELIVIPVDRLSDSFFRLKTRTAGEILQKFMTYHLRVAITGDISTHSRESAALRDFVCERNRGSHIWFVTNIDEFKERLLGH